MKHLALALMKTLGFLVHDILVHPFYGLLSILGLMIPFLTWLADWLHDISVFECNEVDEIWTGRR